MPLVSIRINTHLQARIERAAAEDGMQFDEMMKSLLSDALLMRPRLKAIRREIEDEQSMSIIRKLDGVTPAEMALRRAQIRAAAEAISNAQSIGTTTMTSFANAAFETTAEDVVAAAEQEGRSLSLDEGQTILETLGSEELNAISMAALDADDLDEQASFAQKKLASILVERGDFAPGPKT